MALAALGLSATTAMAEGAVGLFANRQPMFDGAGGASATVTSASLFVGPSNGGLFRPLPRRMDQPLFGPLAGGTVAGQLRDLIAKAEAGRAEYDAVQHAAKVKPGKFPTQMTLAEIYRWIDDTPGQPHAIGRYQFIPATLKRLVARAGYDTGTRFSPAVQDRLADLLLDDAGLSRVQNGEMTPDTFMLNLAKIWAGLPTASGRSYYHGYAGNKATMTWDSYSRRVRDILAG